MAEFFMSTEDYNDIFSSPEQAAEKMELGEGETMSLMRIEVTSCTTYRIKMGNIVAETVSFPDGTISEQ